MKQFKLTFLLAVLMSMVGTKALAFDALIDGIYYNFSGTEASVTSRPSYLWNNYSGSIDIPESVTYNGNVYSVTSIDNKAFSGCSTLTSISLPSSLTNIGNEAFNGCSALTSVSLPSSLTNIGNSAFGGCSALTSINLPSSLTNIGSYAFANCNSLTSIIIPTGITSIGNNTFENCKGLQSISLHNAITEIGHYAFKGCDGLTEITIPNSVTTIGNYAFNGCNSLSSLIIPENVESIGNDAFNANLEKVTILSSDVISSDDYLSHLSRIFGSNVKEYVIGEGISKIGSSLFEGCVGLHVVTIPGSIKDVGVHAFYGCTSLEKVIINDIASWAELSFSSRESNPLYYAGHLYASEDSEITELVIPDGVTQIGQYAFCNCKSFVSVTLPSSLTNIRDCAFLDCDNLQKVIINDVAAWCNVYKPYNGNPLFYAKHLYLDDNLIVHLIIPEGVTTINSGSFYNCVDIVSVDFPNSLNAILGNAFEGCANLISVDLPDNISDIGYGYYNENSNCFPDNVKIFVNKGSKTLLSLWQNGFMPFQKGTENELNPPYLTFISATQSTCTMKLENRYNDYDYEVYCEGITTIIEDEVLIEDLLPEKEQQPWLKIKLNDDSYCSIPQEKFSTLPLSPFINIVNKTASSFEIEAGHIDGDAIIQYESLKLDGVLVEGNTIHKTGLTPQSTFKAEYVIKLNRYDTRMKVNITIVTDPLTMVTAQPKVVSAGNVIVSAQANVDDAEENVGFEWRRTDWSDDFTSNTGQAYMYEGTMEGYIRNLNTEKLWKYRPYYKSDAGTYYYGDWVGIDPTNTSYFEPTVHTYAAITVNGNTALVRGYALQGTDNITVQGFKYWKNASGARAEDYAPALAPTIPADAQTIEADGYVMEASLTGLNYDSEYCYVAFAKTSNGETFYGELRTFTTEKDPTGIGNIRTDNTNVGEVHEVARYNMQGQRISVPERGINIIKMSDGTTRKVVVK